MKGWHRHSCLVLNSLNSSRPQPLSLPARSTGSTLRACSAASVTLASRIPVWLSRRMMSPSRTSGERPAVHAPPA